MEKKNMFMNEVNCSSEQVENLFFNPNLENLMVQNDPFAGEKIVVKELIGRIRNSSQISRVNTDLRFATTNLEYGKLSRVSSNQSITSTQENAESRENSSISAREIGLNDANCRKRKAIPKPKPKPKPISSNVSSENSESSAKRSKSDDDKCADPPKDYIHVRARRGEATDAHSLAERVRREKIGERMKFLQDLVPGCNKVTGKAVMLDEIINYVQSLQRQVEFLSMKLATVNPNVDFNMEPLLSKDMFQSHGAIHHNLQGPNLHSVFPSRIDVAFPTNHFNDATGRNQSKQQVPVNNFNEVVSTFWEDDLHSLVQMGIGQNQTQSFH